MRRRASVAAAVLVAAGLLPTYAVAPARADVTTGCDPDGEQTPGPAEPGRPFESLRIGEVQDWFARNRPGVTPGQGVTVAVLDSGVNPVVPLAAPQILAASSEPGADYYHGTAVAGIIAGPQSGEDRIGYAPAARILDVTIYDDADPSDGDTAVSAPTVANGLRTVLDNLGSQPVKIVNLSVAVPDDPGVEDLVGQLRSRGVIVVAASGNRPGNEEDPLYDDFSAFANGENAASRVFPAGYDGVVGVATTLGGLPEGDNLTDYILQSTAIDLAVPTSGALSYSLSGTPCVLATPATSWAAAEVSGILAVLASAYPDDTANQLVTRLLATTSGRDDVKSPLTGAGTPQPYAALTRPLVIGRGGKLKQTSVVESQERAQVPTEEPDPLVSTRQDMVWFGVLGGGVLVLALVLRPVLARRRRLAR